MNRIVTTEAVTKRDGTVIAAGSTGKVFGFNRDTCNFSANMDSGEYVFLKAWEFDYVQEEA
jgi:hypothetical protein